MCGIFCEVECRPQVPSGHRTVGTSHVRIETSETTVASNILQLLSCRGPDDSSGVTASTGNYEAKLSGHVLWTQGSSLQRQPLVCESRDMIFCFNGDIYSVSGSSLPHLKNDGVHLFELLQSSKNDDEFVRTFTTVEGPFAFILLDLRSDRIWFGRDVFGRSNLLFAVSNSSKFYFSSVAPFCEKGSVIEVPSAGIYCLNLKTSELNLYPWTCLQRRIAVYQCTQQFLKFVRSKLQFGAEVLVTRIQPSVSCEQKSLPANIDDDVILKNLRSIAGSKLADDLSLLAIASVMDEHVNEFLNVLRNAVRKRVELKPPFCKQCLMSRRDHANICKHSKISVLFSGGLDSAVLAYLVCEALSDGDSVDLVNVAFSPDKNPDFNVPDRVTGLQSFKALDSIFAKRGITINFVETNILKSEVAEIRQKHILDLISPLQSVLDDSIGCCLWFAARGKGGLSNNNLVRNELPTMYQSPARIIFVGSGADELLGGYSRHRSAYENRGWQGLVNEMQEDIDRISVRNIGRDNRILSSHGVCPRMPFLDEDVVKHLTQQCDIWVKCCPLFPRGLGEKILLRAAALKLFGKDNIQMALFPKRAMQFGSRIAKLENSKEKGGDVCQRLKNVNILS